MKKQNIFIMQLKEIAADWKRYWAVYLVLGVGMFALFIGMFILLGTIESL
jgi:hypothetical protein